ncbi:MAG: cysteine peptidase family C39 domain-containing protein [Pseudomonadota bacterium]
MCSTTIVFNHSDLHMATQLNQLSFTAKTVLTLSTVALLTSCSSISFSNPFGSSNKELSGAPEHAIAYECEGNKHFYVRMQNNGNDAWLIYPDHEVNLTKASDDNNKFTSGVIVLLINGAETTLNDGEKIAYTACKPQAKN